jgi:hypothetical protein
MDDRSSLVNSAKLGMIYNSLSLPCRPRLEPKLLDDNDTPWLLYANLVDRAQLPRLKAQGSRGAFPTRRLSPYAIFMVAFFSVMSCWVKLVSKGESVV